MLGHAMYIPSTYDPTMHTNQLTYKTAKADRQPHMQSSWFHIMVILESHF